jgi:hypothetical protein
LRSFEEGDDSFALFPTFSPPPVPAKATSTRRTENQKLEQDDANCSMRLNMSGGFAD